MWLPERGLLNPFEPKVENKEDGNVDVSCQEICGVEAPEDFKSIDEDEEYSPSGTPICNIRLEAIVVRVFRQIETLRDHSTTEVEVRDVHDTPTGESTSSWQSDKPVEHLVWSWRYAQEGKEGERSRRKDSIYGETLLRAVGQEFRRLTAESQSVEHARGAEQETISGREGTRENTGIYDMRKNFDSSAGYGNDEGRRRRRVVVL